MGSSLRARLWQPALSPRLFSGYEPGPLLSPFSTRGGSALVPLETVVNSIRLVATVFATLEVALHRPDSPLHWACVAVLYATVAWVGYETLLRPRRRATSRRRMTAVGGVSTGLDLAVVLTLLAAEVTTAHDPALWAIMLLPVVELALRYGLVGGLAGGLGGGVVAAAWTLARADRLGVPLDAANVAFAFGLTSLLGAGVGAGVHRVSRQAAVLQNTLELSHDMVEIISLDGRLLYVSDSCEAILGYTPAELLGNRLGSLIHPEDEPVVSPEEVAWPADGRALHLRRHIRRDGSTVWLEHSVTLLAEEGIVHIVSRDVTERVEADQQRAVALAQLREHQERLSMTLDLTKTITWEYDDEARVLRLPISPHRLPQVPGDGDTISAEEFMSLVHPEDRRAVEHALADVLGGTVSEVEQEFRLWSGPEEWAWIHNRTRVVPGADGRPARIVGVGMDVTTERSAAEALARNELAYRLTLDSITDAFIAADADGRVTDWNPAAETMYGWSREEILGRSMVATLSPPERQDRWSRMAVAGLAAASESRLPGYAAESTGLRRNGERFPIEVVAVPVAVDGTVSLQIFVRDITERKAAEAELARQALIDGLTGLPNRSLLMDRMVRAVSRLSRHPGRLAVLFVDLDRFKVVNDSLGHETGDRILRTVGERLSAVVRDSDTVARFGGDEIVLLCEDVVDEGEAASIADRLLDAVSTPLELQDGRELVLTASVGIAMTDDPGTDPSALIRDADAAMYRAKERGRARMEMFDEDMRARAMAHLEMESDLRRAIGFGHLFLEYQPVVSIEEGRVAALEALVRWDHPTRGVVTPGEFVPLAEETGLIVPVGRWVIEEACRQIAAWSAAGSDLSRVKVAVNLSARQLAQREFAEMVVAAIDDGGVDPSSLCVEITESTLMDTSSPAKPTLERLRDSGITVLLDDFGTGYASLSYLRNLPVDGLKLDCSFVADLGRDETDTAIVDSVVHMAHVLGLSVVAECVERPEQLEILSAMGCDLGQGSHWCLATSGKRLEAVVSDLGVSSIHVGRATPEPRHLRRPDTLPAWQSSSP